MGTLIHLTLGALEIDWGKNEFFANHKALFHESDLGLVPDYGYSPPITMEGYSRPLRNVLSRLELLGYNLDTVKVEYDTAQTEWGDSVKWPISFKKILNLVKTINAREFTGDWSENNANKFVPTEILNRLGGEHNRHTGARPDYWDVGQLLQGFSAYSKLRLLAENPNNLDVPVLWPFGELVENGWDQRENFLGDLSIKHKFLIVTEGSSDSKILSKALSLLKPDYSDFMRFIDMEEGYPFSGTGNLYKFCQGLVSIGISNKVVILYDNDTEGVAKYEATKRLNIPSNMIILKLPDISELKKFDTIGPHGMRKKNINGKAASIECYLDLRFPANVSTPRVRWSSYVESMDAYQGALENKTAYMKAFLNLRNKDKDYNFANIEKVLDHLYKACVKMVNSSPKI